MGIKARNDASLSKLGDIYQYYKGLLDCFTLEKGESLLIEVCGDVSILSYQKNRCIQKEIKHHVGKTALSDRHIDFWKTIKNWVTDYETSSRFKKLEFYTTSDIPDDCKLSGWNEKTAQERYDIISGIGTKRKKNEKTFREFYDAIFNSEEIEKEDIICVLEKVSIIPLEPHINELRGLFDKHISHYIPEANRTLYIDALLGMLVGIIKEPPHKWEITKEKFDKLAQGITASYITDGKAPLPNCLCDLEPSESEESSLNEKLFVKQIERIEYRTMIPQAVSDYWRMNKIVKKYFDDDPTFNTNLIGYRKNLKRNIDVEKEESVLELTENSRREIILGSKRLYLKVIKKEATDFGTIVQNQSFFQCGVIHDIVNEGEFVWYIGDEYEH